MGIENSLFAVFRIVAAVLGRDGVVKPVELSWFLWLIKRYDISPDQHRILMEDLKKESHITEIFNQILPEDHARLVDWLRIAMNIDNHAHPKSAVKLYWF